MIGKVTKSNFSFTTTMLNDLHAVTLKRKHLPMNIVLQKKCTHRTSGKKP